MTQHGGVAVRAHRLDARAGRMTNSVNLETGRVAGTNEIGPVEEVGVFNWPVLWMGRAVPETLEGDVVRGGAAGTTVPQLHGIARLRFARPLHPRGVGVEEVGDGGGGEVRIDLV